MTSHAPLLLLLALAFPPCARAQEKPTTPTGPDLEWFRQARFGLFVHWGPVSLVGTEIGWSRRGERRGRRGTGTVPLEVYDNLYKRFDPQRFDAREWVAIAKRAGMRYLVFTTKHHDGFCMFDSKLTEYKITNSPIGRDLLAELAEACHRGGLKLGFYYSPPDWHHPDYRTERHARYIAYLHGQIRELLSGYGRVDLLWFDGLGGKAADWDAKHLLAMARALQPGIVINNRAGLPADFDTPEQRIGAFSLERPWESCITICRQWAWKPGDRLKSLAECVRTLASCAGGDGNLLLNVGPMPTGAIEPRQVKRLEEIGAWLAKNGESIYGTRGGPYLPGPWGASTRRGKSIYLHIYRWEGPSLKLPALGREIVGAECLAGGGVTTRQDDEVLEVSVPADQRQPIDTVVKLTLAGSALEISPRRIAPLGSLTLDRPARASNVFQGQKRFAPAKAFDGDPATRWATDAGTHQAWIQVDLGAPRTIDRVLIREPSPYDGRVQSFELQIPAGSGWKAILKGTSIGTAFTKRFEPVSARRVRLAILAASEGPTLSEFHLFAPGR